MFSRRPHFGEKRIPVKFMLIVHDINFKKNDYFMEGSTYSVYQQKNKHHKIKSKKSLLTYDDLENVPIDETIKFHATLFEGKISGKLSTKIRKIVIRQNSQIYDANGAVDVYKNIGYIELRLDELVQGSKSVDLALELVDPDKRLTATLNVTIKHKFRKEAPMTLRALASISGSDKIRRSEANPGQDAAYEEDWEDDELEGQVLDRQDSFLEPTGVM